MSHSLLPVSNHLPQHDYSYSISHQPRTHYVYVLVAEPLLVATHPLGDYSLLTALAISSVFVSQFRIVHQLWLTMHRSHDHTLTNDIYNVISIGSFEYSHNTSTICERYYIASMILNN